MNEIYHGDCIVEMAKIPDKSIDMVFTDMPYSITACEWDTEIDLEKLWKELNRVIKPNKAMVFTASQPFTSKLILSNQKQFRCEWIYQKLCASNFAQAKYAPMKEHESVLVFSQGKPDYYPIMEERRGSGKERVKYIFSEASRHKSGEFVGGMNGEFNAFTPELRYPSSVQVFNNRARGDRGLHPTQKPVALCEYFINTYTKKGDVVFDPFAGSGTTLLAAKRLERKYIGIEKETKYYEVSENRLQQFF